MVRFGSAEKLNPRFIGPFGILVRIDSVAYKLQLPSELSNIHPVFHVTILKKCLTDKTLVTLLYEIEINQSLNYMEESSGITDRETRCMKQNCIPIVKVRWNVMREPEFTWEREDPMKQKYLYLFPNP